MANASSKKPKPIKGVYEHPVDSGIWWINYYVEGRRHREKVGRRSDAVTLYQKRKTDARMGIKLPEVRPRRAVLFEEIAEDALVYSKEHKASYPGDRSTVGKLLPVFGKTPVTEITPQSIKAYLDTRDDLTKTTINRYRGTLSMIFQEAIRNGKVEQNPARLVRLHREDNGRVRFVTYEEEALIRRIIRERCPVHEPELTLALETGMRRGEQYSLEWDRVDLERRQLLLLRTKNGTARVVTGARPTEEPSQPATVPVAPPERVFWQRSFKLGLVTLALVVVGVGFWFWHSSRVPAYETLLRNAIQLEAAGDDKLALASLDEALKLNPGSNEALLRAAWLCYEADNDDQATPYLTRMGKSETPSPDIVKAKETRLMGEGLTMLLAGDADGALSKFDVALGFAPNDTDALFHIAEVATANDNFDKADQALQKCFKVDDRNPFCGYQRIETLTYEGHYDLAIKEYARLIQEGSKYPWLDAAVGDAELAMGDTASALRRFNALAVSSHTLASAVHFRASQDGIATVDAYQGKRNDAQVQLKSALETASSGYSKAAYFLLMAKINILYGHKAEGKDDLLNVPSLSHSGELAISLARTFAMADDFVAARTVLHEHSEDAATLGQSFPAAEQFVNGLEALQRHETEESVAQLANSNRMDSSPETAYFMAQAEMEQGDWQGASDSLNDLLSDRGAVIIDGPAALIPLAEYDLSICYRRLGRDADAESHLASVLSMWNKADPDIKARVISSKGDPAAFHH